MLSESDNLSFASHIVGTIKCRKRHFMVLFICNNNIALVPKLKNPSTLFLSLDRPKS